MKNYTEITDLLIKSIIINRLPEGIKTQIIQHVTLDNKLDEIDHLLVSALGQGKSSLAAMYGQAQKDLKHWRDVGIAVTSVFEGNYPVLLSKLTNPPAVLFSIGKSINNLNQQNTVSIIGSRNSSIAGEKFARELAFECCRKGIAVVSGMAIGIDSASHNGAIDCHIKSGGSEISTVAVLGCGVDRIYPPCNRELYDMIIKNNGIILSQFEPGTVPYPVNFLKRNYLIAGLSKGVVVVEAALKSGALSTARLALEEGREVLAVPGDINDRRHGGTNLLIKHGAHLITEAEDTINSIRFEFELINEDQESNAQPDSQCEDIYKKEILKIISKHGTLQKEDLISKLLSMLKDQNAELMIDLIQQALIDLELEGRIEELPGMWIKII